MTVGRSATNPLKEWEVNVFFSEVKFSVVVPTDWIYKISAGANFKMLVKPDLL